MSYQHRPAIASARDTASRVERGEITCEEVARGCLQRIAASDALIGAWEHLDEGAVLAAARAQDQKGRRDAAPLRGVPVGVKDVFDTSDMPTGYGSAAYQGFRPASDAAVVALLRRAGGIVLGKTVTTEFAAVSPGKTKNPHDGAFTPGGSSSGSAAAVAAGMVPIALGTQRMVIGVDLEKDERTLYDAYNDAAGVTARFNLNVLHRINRELGGDFDVGAFIHRAIYNRDRHRIEMHLISKKALTAQVLGKKFSFRPGESIHTESSYKY